MLEDAIVDYSNVDDKRSNVFLKVIKLIKDLQGPRMIINSMLVSKDILQEELEVIKT